MQLVLRNNRIIDYGEGFVAANNGVVTNSSTGKSYSNATVAECENYPSDIGSTGYEYHAGVFVPCAPYGTGDNSGYFMEVSASCAVPRNSGLLIRDIKWSKAASCVFNVAETLNEVNTTYTFPLSNDVLSEYSAFRFVIKAGSYFQLGSPTHYVENSTVYNILTNGNNVLFTFTSPKSTSSSITYGANVKTEFKQDLILPFYSSVSGVWNRTESNTTPQLSLQTSLTLMLTMPSGRTTSSASGKLYYYNSANLIIDLEGRK